MTCTNNVTKGKQLLLLARNAGDTAWELIGGVKSRGYTLDNPTEDTTSSSTTSDYTESEYTGYSQMTMNASGVADKRSGIVDPASGYTIVGYARLLELASTGNRCAKLKMENLELGGNIEGFFNITNFGVTGDTPGIVNFDATFQSKADVAITGAV